MSIKASIEHLQQIPLFGECDEMHLQLLAFASERVRYRPGETIVRAGDKGGAAYLIVSGAADVWVKEDKTKKTVATIGPGALAGELAMIAGLPYPANITADGEVTAIRVSKDVFMRVAAEYPEFASEVRRGLLQRLDSSMGELNRVRRLFEDDQSFGEANERLARTGT